MKKLILAGLLFYSISAQAHSDYGPPTQWNWDYQGRAYPEGRHYAPDPPPRYRENYENRYDWRPAVPGWTCDWSPRTGWGCRIWHPLPYYQNW